MLSTQRLLTAAAVLGLVWGGGIGLTGGGRISALNVDLTATDPYRPLAFAVVAFLLRVVFGGVSGFVADLRYFFNSFTPAVQGWVFTVAILVIGLSNASGVATGSDSYGYISQADLWLKGELVTAQPGAGRVPWPDGQATFAPLGYAPTQTHEGIVPTYAPGFPLVLAIFTLAGGHCAIRWIAPLCGALLVATTFVIGRRAVSAPVAAAAVWLLVTSPIFLFMLPLPMSDMPSAACWALAVYGCMIGSRTGALGAGLAAGTATLVRPNLVLVGCALGLWLAARDWRGNRIGARTARALLFFAPMMIACGSIAIINTRLFGSPTSSGYGRNDLLFRFEHLPSNLLNYSLWMMSSQTPLVLLGMLSLWIPVTRLTGKAVPIHDKSLLGLLALTVAGSYLFYVPFDTWWYVRFFLPAWPAICLGAAYLLTTRSGQAFGKAGMLILVCAGLYGLWYARYAAVFNTARTAPRNVNVARAVTEVTEPDSVIISLQHSGSVRYYGERMTMRYEALDAQWLDRAVEWLRDNGVHPYILLDTAEHEPFMKKFSPGNVVGRLDLALVLEYRDRFGTSTFLYDALQASRLSRQPMIVVPPRIEHVSMCPAPRPLPSVFPLR